MKNLNEKNENVKKRTSVFNLVESKKITLKRASEILCLSYSRVKYLYARFKKEGVTGLEHKGRGKSSNRSISTALKGKVLNLFKTQYSECSLSLAVELLQQKNGISISRETLRKWLAAEGIFPKHKKRRPYKRYLKKSECFGELIQLTAYTYSWLQIDNPKQQCVMVLCDNATNIKLGRMSHHFSVHGAMSILKQWIVRYGIPQTIFLTDKKFIENGHLRKVLQDLGIEIKIPKTRKYFSVTDCSLSILGYRFLCELNIHNIHTINEANTFLETIFNKKVNFNSSTKPILWDNAHILCEDPSHIDTFFFFHFKKKISSSACIFFCKKKYQLLSLPKTTNKQNNFVTLKQYLNGEIKLFIDKQEIEYKIIE